MNNKKAVASLVSSARVTMKPGIERVTLAYNQDIMLCYFYLKKGSTIDLHSHVAAQNGFIVKGKMRFFKKDGTSFVSAAGDGYVFDSNEPHGAEALEDSELVECFAPARPEYFA